MKIPIACVKALRGSRTDTPHSFRLRVEPGCAEDYRSLEAFHYRPARPATLARILRVVDPGPVRGGDRVLAGVLVVSYPALWGTWRRGALPGLFDSVKAARDAERVNRLVRTITRVIVDPRYRGIGAATQLVRAYLSDPCTRVTEAVTSMGRYHPFFESAGMTRFDPPTPLRHQILEARLLALGVRPIDLIDLSLSSRLVLDPDVSEALRAWDHRGHGRSRRWKPRPSLELAALAGAALSSRPVGYVYVR